MALLTASTATAYPEPRDDFGERGFFGSEPNPPKIQPPDFKVPDAELGSVLELVLSGLQATDKVTTTLGDGTMILSVLENNALQLDVLNGDLSKRLVLPPVPEADVGTVTMLITPASISVDRIGDNPTPPNFGGELDKNTIKDASLVVWGLVTDISTTASDPTGRIAAPDHVTATTELHDLVPVTDSVTDMILLDPDDLLQVGSLLDHTIQVPATDDLAVDEASIQNALNTAALTDLSIDGVLTGLKSSVKELGAVDVQNLAAAMVDSDLALRRVSLPSPDPATILDMDARELVLVDGGLGKITAIAGKKDLAFDADLLTQLKDPDSIKDTAVRYVSTDLTLDKRHLGKAAFDPKLGNYGNLLERAKPLLQLGMELDFVESPLDCKQKMATKMQPGVPTLCTGPDLPPVPLDNARLLGYLGKVDKDGLMAKVTSTVPGTGGLKPPVVGTPNGLLPEIPAPDPDLSSIGAFAIAPDLPNLQGFSLPTFELPPAGLASLPEVDAWNLNAPGLPAVEPDMDWPEVSGFDPSVLHGIFETWDSGVLTGLVTVVPLDAATSVFGAIADLASGNGLMALPQSVLQQLPLGTTSELTLRFVGEQGSLFSNTGIEGVRVATTTSDPLGLSTSTANHETNLNGYVVLPVASLGTWSAIGSHDDYEDTQASGQAPPPGGSAGQEMTMKTSSDNAAKDFVVNHGGATIFWLLVALVGGFVLYRHAKNRKGKGRRRVLGVALVLLAVSLAGCAGNAPSQKGETVDSLAVLKQHHIKAECTFTATGAEGIHADLDECKVSLAKGSRDNTSVRFSGHDDNLGTTKPNRKASISTTVYYPDGDNSIPATVEYNLEKDQVETFSATILTTTEPGFGKYAFTFSIQQFEDANKLWPLFQAKSDPHRPDPVQVTFTAGKDTLFGGGV